MKIIFLDIDGVLNNLSTLREGQRFHQSCIDALNTITDITKARIVISSAYRGHPLIKTMLKEAGVTGRIIGITPRSRKAHSQRGCEIAEWLAGRPHVKQFVILDDDSFDMGDLLPKLVRTSYNTGLSPQDALDAIRMLLNQKRTLE